VHREWAIVGTLGARDSDFRASVERLSVMHQAFPEALTSIITSLHAPEDYEAAFASDPNELKAGSTSPSANQHATPCGPTGDKLRPWFSATRMSGSPPPHSALDRASLPAEPRAKPAS
jgi:hypothetical protein